MIRQLLFCVFAGLATGFAAEIPTIATQDSNRVDDEKESFSKPQLYSVSYLGSFPGIYIRGTAKSVRTLLFYMDSSNREYADAALTQLQKFLQTSSRKIQYPFIKKKTLASLREEVGNSIIIQLQKRKNFNNYNLCANALSHWGTKVAYDALVEQISVVSGYDLYAVLQSIFQFSSQKLTSWTTQDTIEKFVTIAKTSKEEAFEKIIRQLLTKMGKKKFPTCQEIFLEKKQIIDLPIFSLIKNKIPIKFVIGGVTVTNITHKRDASCYPQIQWLAKDFFDVFYRSSFANRVGVVSVSKDFFKNTEACFPIVQKDNSLRDLRNVDVLHFDKDVFYDAMKKQEILYIVTIKMNICLWCQHMKGSIWIENSNTKFLRKKRAYIFSDEIVMDKESPHYTVHDKLNPDTPSRGTYQDEMKRICTELAEKLAKKMVETLL